jgi:hypothetical protein
MLGAVGSLDETLPPGGAVFAYRIATRTYTDRVPEQMKKIKNNTGTCTRTAYDDCLKNV